MSISNHKRPNAALALRLAMLCGVAIGTTSICAMEAADPQRFPAYPAGIARDPALNAEHPYVPGADIPAYIVAARSHFLDVFPVGLMPGGEVLRVADPRPLVVKFNDHFRALYINQESLLHGFVAHLQDVLGANEADAISIAGVIIEEVSRLRKHPEFFAGYSLPTADEAGDPELAAEDADTVVARAIAHGVALRLSPYQPDAARRCVDGGHLVRLIKADVADFLRVLADQIVLAGAAAAPQAHADAMNVDH